MMLYYAWSSEGERAYSSAVEEMSEGAPTEEADTTRRGRSLLEATGGIARFVRGVVSEVPSRLSKGLPKGEQLSEIASAARSALTFEGGEEASGEVPPRQGSGDARRDDETNEQAGRTASAGPTGGGDPASPSTDDDTVPGAPAARSAEDVGAVLPAAEDDAMFASLAIPADREDSPAADPKDCGGGCGPPEDDLKELVEPALEKQQGRFEQLQEAGQQLGQELQPRFQQELQDGQQRFEQAQEDAGRQVARRLEEPAS